MYQWERMSRVRVTCLANGDQIYEWSQQFFLKSLLTCILEIFVFKHLLLYILGFYIKKKKQCKEMRQHFLKLELFSPWIYFKMKKKTMWIDCWKICSNCIYLQQTAKMLKKKRKWIISKGVVWSSSKCIFDLIDLGFFNHSILISIQTCM